MLTVSADTMDNNRSRSDSENNGVLVTPTGSFSETTPLQAMVLKKHSEDPVRYGRLTELVDSMAPGQLLEYWKANLIVDENHQATKGVAAAAAAATNSSAAGV